MNPFDRAGEPQAVEIDEICADILDYLRKNPGSRDTLEGIVDWWLMEHDIRRATDKVQRSVSQLVADGQLVERRGPDGRRHYGLSDGPRPEDSADG